MIPNTTMLAMVQDIARNMLKVGGAEPYSHENHKEACEAMTKILRVLAEQEDVK